MGGTSVRLTAPGDASALRELRRRALTLHPEVYGSDVAEEQARPDAFWTERATPTPLQAVFVAERDGVLGAMAGIRTDGRIKTGHLAELWGVFVAPEIRGRGVGDALVAACVAWSRERGLRRIRLEVLTSNAAATRLYLRHGFTVYGVAPDAIRVAGVGYDELMMHLSLA